MGKAIFKFNSGNFAILCSDCSKVVKTGRDFTEEEWSAMEGKGEISSIYCKDCEPNHVNDVEEKKEEMPLDFVKNVLPFLQNEEFKLDLIKGIAQDKFSVDILKKIKDK